MTKNSVQGDDKELLRQLSNEMQRVSNQTKDLAHYLKKQKEDQDSEERSSLEEWQPIQTQYVSSYLEKCISRMNLHEESVRYYTNRHYLIVIPATTMGVITSGAAFSQWSNNVLCGQSSWVVLLVGAMMALTTLLHDLSEFVFAYKDKARQHQQSYINFSRLVKRISNEYNNPVQSHKPYRQFIESISEDYDRYTEHALMVPSSVDKMLLNRWIKSNEMAQEKEQEFKVVKEDHRTRENRIVQQSTINTAIDAATINSTASAMKTISGQADDERVNEALETCRKNRRMSAVPPNSDIVQEFKVHNPLNKVKKGAEIEAGNNDIATARYGILSTGGSARRQSVDADYLRRQSAVRDGQTTTTAVPSGTAAAFAQRSSVLQKATAKFQSKQSKNIPFESMIELNAISSSSSSNSSKATATIDESTPIYTSTETTADELEKGLVKQNYQQHSKEKDDPDLQVEQSEKKEKRRKKKRDSHNSQFATPKYKLDSPSTITLDDEEEDVTPDDVASHVFGQVTYDSITD